MQPLYAKIASYQILSSLRNTLFSRSHKNSQRSFEGADRGWKIPLKSGRGDETRHFDRIYDTVYPLRTQNTTQVSAESKTENIDERGDEGVTVTRDIDVASTKVDIEPRVEIV